MPALVRAREFWAAVEKCRRQDETWMDACEREMYEAILAEGYPQVKIASVMSCSTVEVCRRIKRFGLRRKGTALHAVASR